MTSWLVVSHQRRWFLWIGVNLFLVYKLRNAPPFVAEISLEHLWSRLPAPASTLSLGTPNSSRIISKLGADGPRPIGFPSKPLGFVRGTLQAWDSGAVFICCVYILMFVFGNFYVFLNISFDMFMQMNTEHTRRCQTKRISGNWHFYVVLLLYVVSYHRSATSRPRSIPKHGFSYVTSTLKLGNCNLVLQS